MFITAQFTKSKRCKHSKCPSTDGWTNRIWYVYTMEYYLATKRNKILVYATTQMNLKHANGTLKKPDHILYMYIA